MSSDTFSGRTPASTGTYHGLDDYIDPFDIAHDAPPSDGEMGFSAALAQPGAAKGGYNTMNTPTQADAGQFAIDAQRADLKKKKLNSTTLTSARGLVDKPMVKTASQVLGQVGKNLGLETMGG